MILDGFHNISTVALNNLIAAIVSFGKVTQEQKEEASKYGVSVYSWDEFLSLVRCPSSLWDSFEYYRMLQSKYI